MQITYSIYQNTDNKQYLPESDKIQNIPEYRRIVYCIFKNTDECTIYQNTDNKQYIPEYR